MSENNIFMDGVFTHKKEFSNGYVIKMAIKKERLIAWLNTAPETNGYIKCQLSEFKDGRLDDYGNKKMIAAIDEYYTKPRTQPAQAQSAQAIQQQSAINQDVGFNDDIPF